MKPIELINFLIMGLFLLCYSYQFLYIPVSLFKKPKAHLAPKSHRFAVLIAARNERSVIGELIDSINAQDYPAHLISIFVIADNCTDDTALIAAAHGAVVYTRRDSMHVGKGYALNFLLERIARDYPAGCFDAFIVLDADNVIAPNYITEMNRTFSDGYGVITSYRNSKNYGDNWISAGYALWFLREARYLNKARMLLGSSCAVSGTGFLFSKEILARCGGWNFFLLTEDIEFSIDNVVRGEKIGYCGTAVLYDEQPTSFRQSWKQRLRWSRGYLQVFSRYGGQLMRGILHGSFSCYDMAMNIMPAAVLTGLSLVVNLSAAVMNFRSGGELTVLGLSVLQTVVNLYLTLFVIGSITTITEWKQIHCSNGKKILYALSFPVFMFTYVPITIASLFTDVQWQPIRHERCLNVSQITQVCGKRVS